MHVICADSVQYAAAFYSRFCSGKLIHPPVGSDAYLDSMMSWFSQNPCDVIFPLDEDVLEVLSKHRDLLPNPNQLLLPEHGTLVKALDKSRLIPYASKIGIAVPNTLVIKSERDLPKLANIKLPVVVKPARSSGARGLVHICGRPELETICSTAASKSECLLVQEQIPQNGEGLGYFALYDRKKQLVAQFMHRRLREYPLSGGPSTLREGIWDKDLAEQSRYLLESLGWVGLAMVEYKRDQRDGVPKLMEINARFWGSIALAIFSGVNFPTLAAKVTVGEAIPRVMEYPLGKKAQWLWPGDILYLVSSLRHGRWTKQFFSLFNPNTCYDILSLRDPIPAFALLIGNIRELTLRESDGQRRIVRRLREIRA